MADLPRGIRNNNPGNIVLSDIPWLGKTRGEDDRFETFESAEAGLRALSLNLLNYARKYDLSSVKDIISRYAPSTENNTGSYIRSVAERLGVDPNQRLNLEDPGILARLSEAVVSHENGINPYKTEQYLSAAESARNKEAPATPVTNAPSARVTVPETVPLDQTTRLAKLTGMTPEQMAELPLTTRVEQEAPAEEAPPDNQQRLIKYAQYLTQNQDKANTPEFMTVARAYAALRGLQPSQEPTTPPETPKEKAGLLSSFADTASTLLSAPQAALFGLQDNAKNREELLKAQESKYETTPLSEVKSAGDLVDWLKQQGGAMAGYLAAPGAVAKLANVLTKAPGVSKALGYGVLGAQYAIDNLTRTAQTQAEDVAQGKEPTPVDLTKTLVASAAQTALDVAGFEFFKPAFSRFPILKNLVGEEAGQTAKETEKILVDAFEKGQLSTSRGIVTGLGEGIAFEMPQEIAQQALELWQAGRSLTDENARNEYIEAGAAALIFGGALGGTAKVLENAGKRAEAEDIIRKRAADKIQSTKPETATVQDVATQTPGERVEAPTGEGEPGVSQLLGDITPAVTAEGAPPTTPVKTAGIKIANWETLDENGLRQLREAANEAGVPTSMLGEFETRLAEIQAARQDPNANKFRLNAQVKKNAKLFRQIQKIIAEPPAVVPFKSPEPAATVTPTTPAAPAATVTTPTYQAQTQRGVNVPSGTAASILGGTNVPAEGDTGAQPGATVTGTKVPPSGATTGTGAEPPATGGLGGASVSTGATAGRTGTQNAPLDVTKEIKRAYLDLGNNLGEIEKAALEKPEEVDIEAAQAQRREGPVTKKELAAIPKDPDGILQLAQSSLTKDPFNLTRIQNAIKTAKARPGFDPATDLEGTRQMLAKALRKMPKMKAEGGYKDTIKTLKSQIKEAERLELDPKTRAAGEKLRADIHNTLAKMRSYYKLPAKALYSTKPKIVEPAERTEARVLETALRGKSITDIAEYMVENAPNQAAKVIAERVRDRLRDYVNAGYRMSLQIMNQQDMESRDPQIVRFKTARAVGTHIFSSSEGVSKILLLGSEIPINGYYGTSYETILHELVHAVTSHAIWAGADAKPGTKLYQTHKELRKLYNAVLRHYKARKNLPERMLHRAEYSAKFGANTFKTDREMVAWTLTNKDMQDYMESIPYQGKTTMWDRFVEIVREFLGLSPKENTALSELLRVSNQLMDPQIVRETAELRNITPFSERTDAMDYLDGTDKMSFDDMQARKQAPPHVPEDPADIEKRLAHEIREKTGQNYGIKEAVKQKFTYRNTEELIRLFQNERRPLKRLQDALTDAGKMIVGTKGFNNIYDLIMLSSGKAFHLMARDVQPHIVEMQRAVHDFAQASNLDINSALGRLHMYMMALHEPERRLIKYLKNVPLDNKTKLNVGGKEMTPADIRDAIFRELTKNVDLTQKGPDGKSQADKLRARLEDIVAKYKSDSGFSPVGFKTTDLNAQEYNVIGGYTKAQIDAMREQYNNDPNQKELSALIEAMKKLQANTIKLDKMANYWSQPTTNLTAFYNYQNYVPFKGKPKSEVTAGDESLELGHSRIASKDFNEFAFGTEGRISDSDNPIIQTMVDGAKAATRAGREGVTESLKNLIEQKYVRGKLFKTITFEQRFNGFDPAEVQGKNMYFHYMPDGTIEVYEIFDVDKPISEAIRRTFRSNSPILDMANGLTSKVGALHTRYNPTFHPYNFVRDVLTNTWTVAAEKGGKAAYNFIGSVARQVADGGFVKAGKISRLYADGKVNEIKKMAFNPDGSVKDQTAANVFEYLEEGGRVSYVMGMAMKGQVESMLKEVGQSKIMTTKDQFNKYVDIWTDSFEFTSRAAAYASLKSTYMAGATRRFKERTGRMPNKAEAATIEKGAKQRAAAYAKELANFEQVGVYGREAGAMFMFFRPAATGAVRAIDALRPALESFEQALSHLPEGLRADPKAVAEFRKTYEERRKTALYTITALAGAGAFAYMMAMMAAGDDDQGRNRVLTDDMDIWTRNLRLPIKFMNPLIGQDNDFFNVPWGFGAGAFAAMGAQFMGAALGGNKLSNAVANSVSITLDSFLPIPVARFNPADNPLAWVVDSAIPSILRPAVEYVMNVDTFGKQIYNSRVSRYGDAYSGGEYVPESYKKVTRFLAEISNGAINWQPQTVAFFMNNYADGMTRLATNLHGLSMTIAGNKDFDLKRDLTIFDSFIGKKSSVDARQFAEVEKKVQDMRDTMNMFKNRPNGAEAYLRYIEANPEAPILVNFYNNVVNGPMRTAREQLNKMSASDLPPNQRRPTVELLRTVRDMNAKSFVDLAKAYNVEP